MPKPPFTGPFSGKGVRNFGQSRRFQVTLAEKIDWVKRNASEIRLAVRQMPPPESIVPSSAVFLRKIPERPGISLDYFDVMRQLKGSVATANRFSGVDEFAKPGPSGSYWGTLNGTGAECFYYNFMRGVDPFANPRLLMPSLDPIRVLRESESIPGRGESDVPEMLPQAGNFIANLIFARTMTNEIVIDFDVFSPKNQFWNLQFSDKVEPGLKQIGYSSIMEALLDPEDAGLGRVIANELYNQGARKIYTTSARANVSPENIEHDKAKNLIILGEDYAPITDILVGTAVVKHRADANGATATLSFFDQTREPTRQIVLAEKPAEDRE